MPAYGMVLLVCDSCDSEAKTYEHLDPVDACAELGWEFYTGNACLCPDCQCKAELASADLAQHFAANPTHLGKKAGE